MGSINATHYEDIPTFPSGKKRKRAIVNAVIETCKDSPHKYALRADYGIIAIREVLPGGMHWPYDYGFIPQTLAPDGDALDVLVITQHGLFSGCFVEARVLGAVTELKNKVENDRIIATLLPSSGAPQPTDNYEDISDLPPEQLREIIDFLRTYSEREGNRITIKGVVNRRKAMKKVKRYVKAFERGR